MKSCCLLLVRSSSEPTLVSIPTLRRETDALYSKREKDTAPPPPLTLVWGGPIMKFPPLFFFIKVASYESRCRLHQEVVAVDASTRFF